MRKSLLLITLILISFTGYTEAQSRYKNQISFAGFGGYAENGFYVGANAQQIIGNFYFLGRIDVNYTQQDIDFKTLNTKVKKNAQYITGGIAVGYSLESLIPHPFYLQFFAGPFAGYEIFDNNSDTYNNQDYDNPSKFTGGLYGGIEFEFSVSNNISLLAEFKQFYKVSSDIGNSYYNLGVGIKYSY